VSEEKKWGETIVSATVLALGYMMYRKRTAPLVSAKATIPATSSASTVAINQGAAGPSTEEVQAAVDIMVNTHDNSFDEVETLGTLSSGERAFIYVPKGKTKQRLGFETDVTIERDGIVMNYSYVLQGDYPYHAPLKAKYRREFHGS
jgi:hypothetical protein